MQGVIMATERLDLQWFTLAEVEALQKICESKQVAAMSGSIAHPYPAGHAEKFIRESAVKIEQGDGYSWAVFERSTGDLLGDTMLTINKQHHSGEFGYLLAEECWGKGYATEILAAVIEYGFETLGLRRIVGICSANNTASARVMEKNGMLREGHTKDSYLKWGVWEDELHYGLTRPVFELRKAEAAAG
jgi:RimJ/RimL family protein N-acetyltransferase